MTLLYIFECEAFTNNVMSVDDCLAAFDELCASDDAGVEGGWAVEFMV